MTPSPKGRLPIDTYVQGILDQNKVILSKAITVSESTLLSDRHLSREILKKLLPHTGNSFRIGITGIPGVGKSTFIDTFGEFLTKQSLRVAVLAIDPSSTYSQGSILGDKTRMHRLARNPMAYVRPSPTAGSLGGVSRRTREALLLCEAAGYEMILIETVGVGQSEVAVHHMVDAFLLLAIPHTGDELQGIKRGIMEMADIIFMNKAENELLASARKSKAQLSQALRLYPPKESGWKTKLVIGSALHQLGIDQLWDRLCELKARSQKNGYWNNNRQQQALTWMLDHIRSELESRFLEKDLVARRFPLLKQGVLDQEISPIQAAEELLALWQSESGTTP
ncbi:MAG: methylmalonyl Co-A mutase-associated GTPase MeaB [Bacteroidota bacterium]